MMERAGQVNARFAGGSLPAEQVTQALLALGLEERQITIVKRADPGDWREPEAEAGLLSRLLQRFVGRGEAAAAPTPDALLMVYLSQGSGIAEQVQETLRGFGATRVDYYPAGVVASGKSIEDQAGPSSDASLFKAAFPDGEQRKNATKAQTPGGGAGKA